MKTKAVTFALVGAMIIASPVEAQRRNAGNNRVATVENVLRLRERLELTGEQVAQLNQIRLTQLERRGVGLITRMEVQSRIAAGEITRSEARAEMRSAGRVPPDSGAGPLARVNSILTEPQQAALRDVTRRSQRQGRNAAGPSRGRGKTAMRANRGQGQRSIRRGAGSRDRFRAPRRRPGNF